MYPPGTKVRFVRDDDYYEVPAGTIGTVWGDVNGALMIDVPTSDGTTRVHVEWDVDTLAHDVVAVDPSVRAHLAVDAAELAFWRVLGELYPGANSVAARRPDLRLAAEVRVAIQAYLEEHLS